MASAVREGLVNGVHSFTQGGVVGQFQGRKVSHWSIYVLQAGAAVGVIACVASLVITGYVMGTILGVLAATNAIGFYFLQQFVPQGSIEDDADRVESLLKLLDGKNDKLKVAVDRAGNVVTQASIVRKNATKSNTKAEQLLRKLNSDLAAKTKQLKDALKALDRFEKLFHDVEKARVVAVREITTLARDDKRVEEGMTKLETFSQTVSESLAEMPTDIVERLERSEQVQNEMRGRHEKLTEVVEAQVKAVEESIATFSEELGKQVDRLDDVDDTLTEAADKVKEQAEQIGEVAEKFNKELRQTDKYLDKKYLLDIISKLTEKNKKLKQQLKEVRS